MTKSSNSSFFIEWTLNVLADDVFILSKQIDFVAIFHIRFFICVPNLQCVLCQYFPFKLSLE